MTRWTFHGGRLAEARAAYGDSGEPWLDLSTGINPHAWPHANSLEIDWQGLPDEAGIRDLEQAAAAFFGVDPTFVTALPGTEIGLRLLGDLLPGRARHVWPAYRTHEEMFGDSSRLQAAELATASDGIVILANPNNPDGHVVPKPSMLDLLGRLRRGEGWLVVDEAFADAAPNNSLTAHVEDDAPLVLFRSFGKFFGLAGVRLGFVIGPRRVVADVRARLGAWPVSAAAIAIGAAAYRDGDWAAEMRKRLPAEAAALDRVLGAHGFTSIGDCPLFRLVETSDAAVLFDQLAHKAILTRPFDYDPRWLRIGLPGSDAALARLDRALARG